MQIKVNAIVPPQGMSSARFRGLLLSHLQKIGRRGLQYAESTCSTFVSFNPEFTFSVTYAGGDAEVSVTTDSDIWHWLDEGTSERWAVMRSPYLSKTQPGAIQSNPGLRTFGGPNGEYTAIRGRRAMMAHGMGPMPGIESRDFSGQIGELLEEELEQEIGDVMDEAFG
jgi:hypothetical protein